MGINKENRPPADLDPSDEEGVISAKGLKSALTTILWEDHYPKALSLDSAIVSRPFVSGGWAPGGRFVVTITPPAGVAGYKVWMEDPTANAGNTDGYLFEITDGGDLVSDSVDEPRARHYNVSDPSFSPPLAFYVSSNRFEKRILRVQPYPAWDSVAGQVSGTPLPTLTYSLTPPPINEAVVTSESPEGHVSSRWRKISFSAQPMDWRKNWGAVVRSIVSPTSFKTENFDFPAGTTKFKPGGIGRDVFLYRPQLQAGALFGDYPWRIRNVQWPGQGQFRRILSVTDDGSGNGVVEYDAPFDPPLVAQVDDSDACDMLSFVDKCVMVRVSPSQNGYGDLSFNGGEFRPVLGALFLEMWSAVDYLFGGNASGALQAPDNLNYLRHYQVEWYLHDAGYQDDGDFESDSGAAGGYVDEAGASFPPTAVKSITIRAQKAPAITEPRIMESQANSGKLRVEIGGLVGDVNRWRVYANNSSGAEADNTEWPTTDGQKYSPVDDSFLQGEWSRQEWFAETDFVLSGNQKVILVPIDSTGEWSVQRPVFRLGGPETLPIFYNVKIEPADISFPAKAQNKISWQANGAALDLTHGAAIIHERVNHMGMHHGESPPKIIWQGNVGTLPNPFTHDGNTLGAEIDLGRGGFDYAVTHRYTIVLYKPPNPDIIYSQTFEKTDGFSLAHSATLGDFYAVVVETGTLDDQGRVLVPVVVTLRMVGAKNMHYHGNITSNTVILVIEYSTDGKANTDPTKVWNAIQRDALPQNMSTHLARHQIWDKQVVGSGGTVYPLVYRASWVQTGSFSGPQAIVYSNTINIRLADVPAPGPF